MKFLDIAGLNEVTQFLETLSTGDRRLRGRVEAYSCKVAGEDKKTHKELDAFYEKESKGSSSSYGSQMGSAMAALGVGDLADAQVRRLLINLICTMNATFPDYDFKALGPDRFVRQNLGVVVNSVNSRLSEMVEQGNGGNFLEMLWGAIDAEIGLKTCEVLSYVPDAEDDPFNVAGSVWSFNFFFYSQTERKIVFLTCCCLSAIHAAGSDGGDLYGVISDGEADEQDFDDESNDSSSEGNQDDGDLLDYGMDDIGEMDEDP